MTTAQTHSFRPIPGFPAYEINRQGHLRRRTAGGGHPGSKPAFAAGRAKRSYASRGKTLCVTLWRNGQKNTYTTAQLISAAFNLPLSDLLDHAKGERHGMAKLTAGNVLTARELARAGETHRSIARMFGVHRCTVSRAVKGETWTHLEKEQTND